MFSNWIRKYAYKKLTDAERELYDLLTQDKCGKSEVLGFLQRYDIDHETAVTTYFINFLLDRFQLSEADHPSIPRIRGVAAFFRFQNATALMKLPTNEIITDVDLALRIRYSKDIRPFSAVQSFSNQNSFRKLFAGSYVKKALKCPVTVKMQNKEYRLPADKYLPILLYGWLYRACRYRYNRNAVICYLYDIWRYCDDYKPGIGLYRSLGKMELRHWGGTVKRWFLKSKN